MISQFCSKFLYASSSSSSTFIPIPNRETFKKFAHISFYKRKEPTKGINFLSKTSQRMLAQCITTNTANPFFMLSDQYITQADPAFCGPTNIALSLNALQIDPNTKWKGIWRWYDEYNIKCMDIEKVLDYGMTLPEFNLLLQCNGAYGKVYRPYNGNNINLYPNFNKQQQQSSSLIELKDDLYINKYNCIKHKNKCKCSNVRTIPFNIVNEEFLRTCALMSSKYNNCILMCNLGRGALDQTGDGHFTPITAYHMQSDRGLLLDSARFKYNSRWYKISDIYKALIKKDGFTNLSRGFMLIHKQLPLVNVDVNTKVVKYSEVKRLIVDEKRFPQSLLQYARAMALMFNKKVNVDYKTVFYKDVIKLVKEVYYKDKLFKKYVDMIYMYDRTSCFENVIGNILMFNNKLL